LAVSRKENNKTCIFGEGRGRGAGIPFSNSHRFFMTEWAGPPPSPKS
jgi:hypothetical protein